MKKSTHIYKENNPNKKNCLMILPRPIFPVLGGYSNKNYNLIPSLSNAYNLHLVVLSTCNFTKEEEAYYEKYICSWTGYVLSPYLCWIKSALYLLIGKPIQTGYFYCSKIDDDVEKLSQNMDIVIGNLVRTIPYLRNVPDTKIRIFDMVDSIGINYRNSYSKTTNFFWKEIYKIESERLIRYERLCINKYDMTFFVNKQEEENYQTYGKTAWLPHGVKTELFTYTKYDPRYKKSVVFIGKMNYQPNVEAVKWYINHVHVKLYSRVKLIVVGAYPTREILELSQQYKNIEITGYCNDPYIYLKSCLAIIAPMQTGGGIQNKVLEGMAIGNINIISPLAAKPIIGAHDMEHFFVASKAEEYVFLINELLKDKNKYIYIAYNARSFIKTNFTWDAYNKLYVKRINEIVVSRK